MVYLRADARVYVAAIAAVNRELGIRWAAAVVIWQCAIAWIFAMIVHLIGTVI